MRRLVIASFLFASVRIAASQPAKEPTPPPDGDKKAEPAKAEPAKTEPAKGDEKKPAPENEEEVEEGEPAEPPPPPVEEPAKDNPVSAKYDNGLKLESADKAYEVKLAFRIQTRLESTRPTETGSQFLNHFYVPRSRVQAEGHVFGDDNRFKLELGADAGSFSFAKDVFFEKKLPDSPVVIRAGQWKRPFSRLEMVSDFASQLNERSIVNELAGGGRDVGLAVHNEYEKSPEGVEWAFGVFNGFSGGSDRPSLTTTCIQTMTGTIQCLNSRPSNFPNDFGPTVVARAGWNSARAKGYSEGDLEGGPLRYSAGASYKIDLANFAKHGQPSLAKNLSHGLELDWNIKSDGISVSGEIVMMKLKSADAEYGFVVQPGMMLVPKHMEVVGRFGLTTEHRTAMGMTTNRNNIEALGGFNYYMHGHKLKIASDFGILKKTGTDPGTMASDKPDIRVRIMGQIEI